MLKYFFLIGGLILIIVGTWMVFHSGQKFGAGIPLPPQNETYTDQEIHDIIAQAETDGVIPEFDVSRIADTTDISTQYIAVAQENGVDVSAQPNVPTDLYIETRDSMEANGVDVQPLSPEAEQATSQPLTP